MRKLVGFILGLSLINSGLKSQNVIMDLGGPTHCGVYNTKPVKQFNSLIWKTEIKGIGQQNCILKDNKLYISSFRYNKESNTNSGFIYSIDSKNGSIVWQDTINQRVSSPTIKDNTIYYGSDELKGKQYACNINTGKVLWTFDTQLASCWPPSIVGNRNYFGSHGDKFYVLDNQNGELIKETTIEGGICCCPSVLDSTLYFVDRKGILHAYDTKKLEDLWIYNTGSKSYNSPAIVNGVAYLINETGTLYAIDIKNGKLIWSFKMDDTTFRSPAVKDGVATLITTNGHIYAFNIKDGSVLWDLRKPGLGYTNTAIVDNIVYVGCADNHLYALELNTGKEIWNYTADSPVNTPLIDNGVVYFTSGKYVYALK